MTDSPPIALVTGAGGGIGQAVSLTLAQNGYRLCLLGRRRDRLEETALRSGQNDMLILTADVADNRQVERAFAEIERRFGRLDLLFNNAGLSALPQHIDEQSVETWRQVIDVNLNGAYHCARAAFGLMRRQRPQGGRIINNGSISAHSPRPLSAAYTVSKYAITGLTRSLSLDGRAYDIACGQIDIGNAGTSLTRQISSGVLQADGSMRSEPMMDVQQVADAVLLMAQLPLSTNILDITIMATKMPLVGRG